MPSLSARERVGVLVALAIIAYLPALRLPFIADDYTQIPLARHFADQGWTPLLSEVNLRSRATYMFLSAVLDRTFGFNPLPFYAAGILIHTLCTLLVYASGAWIELGETAAFWAAAFFAVEEGHQEAIMWPAAAGDLLVFLFGMAAWVCWVKWLQGGGWKWYAAAVAAFLLAALSKESVWVFGVLMLLPVAFDRRQWKRGLAGVAPFLAMAALYMFWTWAGRVAGPGYHDNRFSLSAPWFHTLLNSWWRLLFVWGLVAGAALVWAGRRSDSRLASAASVWMILGLVPFSFLTYMSQVPSRQTYIASAGLAWLLGVAVTRLQERGWHTAMAIVCIAALTVNLEIIWVKKMSQFRERAEPSELVKQAAAESDGTVTIGCVPLPDFVVEEVLKSVGAKAVFEHPGVQQGPGCFLVEYRDRSGKVVRESRRLGTERHGAFY